MNCVKRCLGATTVILAFIIASAYIPVTTYQGVNGEVRAIKIPLYVKAAGFLYRDHQYKMLADDITAGHKEDLMKVIAIYRWTVNNIKHVPSGFKVVDDHIWDIIVRGYGEADQMADVFTTLASYSGRPSFWDKISVPGSDKDMVLSFVKIKDRWYVFDIYNAKFFIKAEDLAEETPYGVPYSEYVNAVPKDKFRKYIQRPDKQKVAGRIIFEIKKVFGGK